MKTRMGKLFLAPQHRFIAGFLGLGVLFGCLFSGLIPLLEAADLTVEQFEAAPPEGASEDVVAALDTNGFRVLKGGEVIGEFWLRPELPLQEPASTELGVGFGQLQEGSLIGLVHYPLDWSDYKDNQVAAGVYTLRYGVQPADGNHMGVSLYRDFLLLTPAGFDTDPDQTYSHDDLAEHSSEASEGQHPAALSLFPAEHSSEASEGQHPAALSLFCRLPYGASISKATLAENLGKIEPGTWKAINDHLVPRVRRNFRT